MNSSVGTTITFDLNPKSRVDAQSEAAKTIGRRREQNRIAQRNHRNKIRERQGPQQRNPEPKSSAPIAKGAKDGDGDIDSHVNASNTQTQTENQNQTHSHTHSQTPDPQALPSLATDGPLITNAAEGIQSPESLFSGPHMDIEMDQFSCQIGENFAELDDSCMCNNTLGPCEFHRAALRVENNMIPMDALPHMGSLQSLLEPMRPLGAYSAHPSNLVPAPQSIAAEPQGSQGNRGGRFRSSVTARFQNLLQHVEAAGFKSFDEAVATYYTHDFEPSSGPHMAQKASRGRRLRSVLMEIKESSANWTFWESRGYREQVLEAAEGIYVEEIAQLSLRKNPMQGFENANMMFASDDMEEDQVGSRAGPSAAQSLDKVYQNELPNLWALLTGLAGCHGATCDMVALAALSLLCSSAQDPDMDLGKQISRLAMRFNTMGSIHGNRSPHGGNRLHGTQSQSPIHSTSSPNWRKLRG